MVHFRRNLVPGGTFFFTTTLLDRRSDALVAHIGALRSAFRRTCAERPFTVDAIVVLPDHLHMIMTLPANDADYPGRWRRIKSLFTRHVAACQLVNADWRGENDLWQRRFWEHTIRDDEDFARHFAYVHFNPVKHGLVRRVSDWPHSSFHRHVQRGDLPLDWGGTVGETGSGFGGREDSRS